MLSKCSVWTTSMQSPTAVANFNCQLDLESLRRCTPELVCEGVSREPSLKRKDSPTVGATVPWARTMTGVPLPSLLFQLLHCNGSCPQAVNHSAALILSSHFCHIFVTAMTKGDIILPPGFAYVIQNNWSIICI